MTPRSRRAERPQTEMDRYLSEEVALPKPKRVGKLDTRGLELAKIHPLRNREFLTWLRRQPCSVAGMLDQATGQPHVCWSPEEWRRGVFKSDPAHCGKAISGRMKRSDAEAFSLCRHAHRDSEMAMDAFDRRFGIDRFEIAARQFAQFTKEQERKAR